MVLNLKMSVGIVNQPVIGKMSAQKLKDSEGAEVEEEEEEDIRDLTLAHEDIIIGIETMIEIDLTHVLDLLLIKIIEEEKEMIMIEVIEEYREVAVSIEEEKGEIMMIKEMIEGIEDIMKEIIEVTAKVGAEAEIEIIESDKCFNN